MARELRWPNSMADFFSRARRARSRTAVGSYVLVDKSLNERIHFIGFEAFDASVVDLTQH